MGKERLWAVGSSALEDDMELGPAIVGTCPDMCSAHERAMRERLHDLSPFEQEPGKAHKTSRHLAVKKFCRTQRDVQASEVRPLAVLRRTMHHLLSVLPPHTRDLPSAYPFLCDRFRAVRQEMVMQGIGGQNALDLLLPMIRFHILAAAVIPNVLAAAGTPARRSSATQGRAVPGASVGGASGFDTHLNLKFLGQCLLFALECFPAVHRHAAQGSQQKEAEGSSTEESSSVTERHPLRRCDRQEMAAQARVLEGDAVASQLAHSLQGLELEGRLRAGEASGPAASPSPAPTSAPASAPASNGGCGSCADALSRGECFGQCAEAEVWSFHVLLHLGPLPALPHVDSMAVVLSAIPRHVFACRVFQVALRAMQCYRSGNYVGYFRIATAPTSAASPWQLCLLHLHAPQVLQQCLLATHASGISQYPVSLAYLGRTVFLDAATLGTACREGGFPLSEEGSGEDATLIPKGQRTQVQGSPSAVFLPLPSRLVQKLEVVNMQGLLGSA